MAEYSVANAKLRCDTIRLEKSVEASRAAYEGRDVGEKLHMADAAAIAVLLAHVERLEASVKELVDFPDAAARQRGAAVLSDTITLPEPKPQTASQSSQEKP
jgi:hypothetical protein